MLTPEQKSKVTRRLEPHAVPMFLHIALCRSATLHKVFAKAESMHEAPIMSHDRIDCFLKEEPKI